MTEAMNYFQTLFSLFSFNGFAPAATGRHETKLVRDLIKDAQTLARRAKAEINFGAAAQKLMNDAKKKGARRLQANLAEIARWHFECALHQLKNVATRYDEAGRIQTKQSRIFFAEAKTLAKRANRIAALLKSLDNSLTRN